MVDEINNLSWIKMDIRQKFAFIKLLLARGQSWTSDLKNIAMFVTFFKIWGLDLWVGFILGFVTFLGFIVMGYIDLKVGIWKTERDMDTGGINPYFQRLEQKVSK